MVANTLPGFVRSKFPVQHPRWLIASWVSLMICAACSLFWSFVHGYYGHYALGREYAKAVKEKYETDPNEILNLNITNLRTVAEIAAFRNPRLEAAKETDKNLQYLRRGENFYMHLWRWLGRLAHLGFLLGLGLLLAFAIKNM